MISGGFWMGVCRWAGEGSEVRDGEGSWGGEGGEG
jgi:hypothetical protein